MDLSKSGEFGNENAYDWILIFAIDRFKKATETVLEQARMMANGFSKARTYSLPESGELGMVAED